MYADTIPDVDERCHLLGTTKLLNSISSFAADGGLRESASWASLRQQIYISLTSQHPLAIDLTTYRNSSAFSGSDDESAANRIIFIFASILTATFQPEIQLPVAQWKDLDAEVQNWNMSKPWNFTPLWIDDSVDEGQDLHQHRTPWPEMLMSHPSQGMSSSPDFLTPTRRICDRGYDLMSHTYHSSWNAILLPGQDHSIYL